MSAQNFTQTLDASGKVFGGLPVTVERFFIGGMDEANDPEIEFFNGQDDTGTTYIPDNEMPASDKGFNGIAVVDQDYPDGCYVKITMNGGTGKVSVVYRPLGTRRK